MEEDGDIDAEAEETIITDCWWNKEMEKISDSCLVHL